MPRFINQLVTTGVANVPIESNFWQNQSLTPFNFNANNSLTLNSLTSRVRKNPNNLHAHIHRINFCYCAALSEQLYAALLDLLIVLQNKGKAISLRMIKGSRKQLSPGLYAALMQADGKDFEKLGNAFSLFTTGRIGQQELVRISQSTQSTHDPLTLANDFIEFSQLDEAMEVLEAGLRQESGRQDLQNTLLELYQCTHSTERMQHFYQFLQTSGAALSAKWPLPAKPADPSLLESGIWYDLQLALSEYDAADTPLILNSLTNNVSKNPNNLNLHIRRISFCYSLSLADPLYAAILDLLIILQGKGKALSDRMIKGSRKILSEQQCLLLLETKPTEFAQLGNTYSLFAIPLSAHEHQITAQTDYDWLSIANDFIQYSQLEQAMETLEAGLKVDAKRLDLQNALFELYQSTQSYERMQNFYLFLNTKGVPLSAEWHQVIISQDLPL